MKHSWNQRTLQPETQYPRAEQADAGERPATQRAQAIRARANRLYVLGELALAAQLLMELEMQPSWA